MRETLIFSNQMDAYTERHPMTVPTRQYTMSYALSWIIVAALVALWSLTAWALHAMAVWAVSNAGALPGVASGIDSIALPDWLAPWVPTELGSAITQLMVDLGPWVDSLLQALPALAGGLTVVAWMVWAIGSVLFLLMSAGLHLLITLWHRHGDGGSDPNGGYATQHHGH